MSLTVISLGFGGRTGTAGVVTLGFGTVGSIQVPTTGGVPRNIFTQRIGESEEDKRARRIREGTIAPDVADIEPAQDERAKEYARQSAKLTSALTRLRGESTQLREQIARLEESQANRQTAKAQKELTLKRQAEQLAQVQQALILEQMEVLDIAYVAMAALQIILQS